MANRWPYNTTAWQRLRAHQLALEPLCRYCRELGHTTSATEVDHIVPVRTDPARAFDDTNVQSLCRACHAGTKQSEERTGERRGCSVDGIPLKGWD